MGNICFEKEDSDNFDDKDTLIILAKKVVGLEERIKKLENTI